MAEVTTAEAPRAYKGPRVDLQGKGAHTGVNVIAVAIHSQRSKDEKTQYVDAMIDHRDQRAVGQRDLHLAGEFRTRGESRTVEHGAPYRTVSKDPNELSAMANIIAAAGPNKQPYLNKEGVEIGTQYAFKANVKYPARASISGLMMDTKNLGQSDFLLDSAAIEGQRAALEQAKELGKADKAARDAAKATAAPKVATPVAAPVVAAEAGSGVYRSGPIATERIAAPIAIAASTDVAVMEADNDQPDF